MSFCGTASPSRRCASPGLFCFPGFASYQEVKADDPGKALAPWEIGSYLLGTCSYVKEAIAAAKSVLVGAVVQKDMGFGGVKIPWMLLTGTKDSNPINGADAKTRLVVFPDLRRPRSINWCSTRLNIRLSAIALCPARPNGGIRIITARYLPSRRRSGTLLPAMMNRLDNGSVATRCGAFSKRTTNGKKMRLCATQPQRGSVSCLCIRENL